MKKSLSACGLLVAAIVTVNFSGCGGDDPDAARPDIAAIPAEEHFGGAIKSVIYEFRAKVRKRGVPAAKAELPLLLENFDGYEQQALGEHEAIYKEIVDKLKALESSLGSASRDSVVKAVNEIGTLADKLPGKANENPVVD
jgi:hypothetical protein